MANIIDDSFSIVFAILRSVGLYHEQPKSFPLKLWTCFWYVCGVSLVVLTFVNVLVEKNVTLREKNQTVIFLAEALAGCCKLLPFLVNGSKVKKCVETFGRSKFLPKNEEEREILADCVWVCSRNARAYISMILTTATLWHILPFFEPERRFPLNVWVPFGTKNSIVFYSTYFYVVTACMYIGISELVEPLVGGLAYHAAGQFKILKSNLRRLRESGSWATLKQCVIRHNDILMFIKEFENCFSWCIFCQIAANLFGLCFSCIGFTMVSFASLDAATYVMLYVSMALQLLFYCHYGTLLVEENNHLINAIYMDCWYKYDIKKRKMLIIMMERSKIPVILTAGKIINLTLDTFASVLKTSYSLIAVLKKEV